MKRAIQSAALLACGAGAAFGQSVESDVTPESAHLVKDDSAYAVPDLLSDKTLDPMNLTDAPAEAERW